MIRIRRLNRKRPAAGWGPQTERQEQEVFLCHPARGVPGFTRFCERHVWIEHGATKIPARFTFFPGQARVVPDLVDGLWLLQLKGRQVGFTTLWVVYVLWRIIYSHAYRAMIIFQERQYAEDFILRLKYSLERLPAYLQPAVTTDNRRLLRFGPQREVRALVGSTKAARSVTGDLVLYDEASRVPHFADSLAAAQPAMEVAGGQIGVLTTSAGPAGDFYSLWLETYGDHGELLDEDGVGPTGFKLVFIHWSERPGRDAEWYAEQKRRLDALGPTMVKQEYPETPEEAFEYAAGRVFPLFTRDRCIGDVPIPDTALRYRAIDWGETKSAYVVLWIAHIPGPPGFLVSPRCPNTIREFLAYRWDDEKPGRPLKRDDHCPDAVRYAVVTWSLTGLVYVYREVYRTDSLAKGWNPMLEIEEIHQESGWLRAQPGDGVLWRPSRGGELYEGTVADPSWGKAIAQLRANQIPCVPAKRIKLKVRKGQSVTDTPLNEKLEGIRAVSALIDGSLEIEKRIDVTREGRALRVYYQTKAEERRVPHTTPLRQRRLAQAARDLLVQRRLLDRK